MPKNSKVKVKVAGLSGFDKSFHNLLTAQCGTLVPVLTDLVIPGQKIKLNYGLSATMPPLASDTYGKMSIRTEAFFVPMRLVNGGFEDFFTQQNVTNGVTVDDSLKGACPAFYFESAQTAGVSSFTKAGSLSDYLGMKVDNRTVGAGNSSKRYSLMPFLAYHRIYDDWYKNGYVQKDVFVKPIALTSDRVPDIKQAPFFPYRDALYLYKVGSDGTLYSLDGYTRGTFDDGKTIFDLRQRNFGDDYFTLARPNAQFGDAMSVSGSLDITNLDGGHDIEVNSDEHDRLTWRFDETKHSSSFTIAALRAANSLQQYKERKNLANTQYVDQIFSQYGVRPSDGVAQRSILLGASEHEIYSKGVFQSSNTSGAASTQNPFSGSVAAEFGSARASGVTNDFVSFEAKEPGYIMVLASLVPRVSYGTGIKRFLRYFNSHDSIVDLPNHLLQNTGNQSIFQSEVNGNPNDDDVFGYVQRYADFMTREDEIHGLFKDGQSLESFALQRSVHGDAAVISDSFLQIPTSYLDQVAAVESSISNFGYWMDIHFDYKIVAPLEQYSLPSLQDPAYEHGRDITVDTRGSNL